MIINLQNTIPILQQTQKTTVKEINKTVLTENKEYNINQKISYDVVNLINALFIKPDNINWPNYLIEIINKENRIVYLGLILIIIAIYILFLK